MKKEIWKDVLGYEGLYQVSNIGRVRSLDKTFKGSNQYGSVFYITKKGKILSPRIKKGYLSVHLCRDNTIKEFFVHRLVAYSFIPNHKNLSQINHVDENKENNCVDNLEWCTSKYNNNYGTRNSKISSKVSKPVNQYDLNYKLINKYESITIASKETNTRMSSLVSCCKGKYKTANGYIWEYAKK